MGQLVCLRRLVVWLVVVLARVPIMLGDDPEAQE